MRSQLFLAAGVVALSAVSHQLFAAEMETPAAPQRAAPAERAAPAAERTAPVAARAAPARERAPARRAAPAQQVAQPQTSSYTGAQAGGFGGGNVAGGGFADPFSPGCAPAYGFSPICTTQSIFNQSLRGSGGVGGALLEYKWAVTPWIVVGVIGDLSFGKTTSTSTQSSFYPSGPRPTSDFPAPVTSETYSNSVTLGTNGSVRLKVGYVVPLANGTVPGVWGSVMPYVTIGWIRSGVQGSFSYAASSYSPFTPACAFSPACSVVTASAVNWSDSRNGVVTGAGVEVPLPAFGPGVVLVADWTYANFGSFDVALPIAITNSFGTACTPGVPAGTTCGIADRGHVSNLSFNSFRGGIKIRLF
jgi:hypothetical protein